MHFTFNKVEYFFHYLTVFINLTFNFDRVFLLSGSHQKRAIYRAQFISVCLHSHFARNLLLYW